jgi:hypothetical protein
MLWIRALMSAPQAFVDFIDEMRADAPALEIAQMFGKPCSRLAGQKPVLSFFQDSMVFKLGVTRVQEVFATDAETVPFDPSGKGRPFKDWVQVPQGADTDWHAFGLEALGLK